MTHYIVLGKKNCPYCTSAVSLLESKQLSYDYIDIEGHDNVRTFIKETLGVTSVPQIFTHVGGFSHLKEMLDNNTYGEIWDE